MPFQYIGAFRKRHLVQTPRLACTYAAGLSIASRKKPDGANAGSHSRGSEILAAPPAELHAIATRFHEIQSRGGGSPKTT